MALKTFDDLPAFSYKGDTVTFRFEATDYDPATDACTVRFIHEQGTDFFEVLATDNGDGRYLVVANGFDTAGDWNYTKVIVDGTDTQTFESGQIAIRTAPAAGVDQRSTIKRTLDAIEATLEGKADSDQLSYSIANRSVSKMSPAELTEWHTHYKTLYAEELSAQAAESGVNQSFYYAEF